MKKIFGIMIAIALLFGFTVCSDPVSQPDPDRHIVNTIAITGANTLDLVANDYVTLTATVTWVNTSPTGVNSMITWRYTVYSGTAIGVTILPVATGNYSAVRVRAHASSNAVIHVFAAIADDLPELTGCESSFHAVTLIADPSTQEPDYVVETIAIIGGTVLDFNNDDYVTLTATVTWEDDSPENYANLITWRYTIDSGNVSGVIFTPATGSVVNVSAASASAGVIHVFAAIASDLPELVGDESAFHAVTLTAYIPTFLVIVNSAGTGYSGGGSFAAGTTVNINAGTPPIGQQFVNWTTGTAGVNFDNANNAQTFFEMPASAVTVTANFAPLTFTVTFDANSGYWDNPTDTTRTDTVNWGGTAAAPTIEPTKDSYTFEGWYTATDVPFADVNTNITANLVLYAQWEAEQMTPLTTIAEIEAFLAENTGTRDNPLYLPVQITLSTWAAEFQHSDSGWQQLMRAIAAGGQYVNLNLALSPMAGDFRPAEIEAGKNLIVWLTLPNAARRVFGDGWNAATAPFRFFTNLERIDMGYLGVGRSPSDILLDLRGGTFFGLTNLRYVDMSKTALTRIGTHVFNGCINLETVLLPDTVTEIMAQAFFNCHNLRLDSLPPNLTEIGNQAFGRGPGIPASEFVTITSLPDSLTVLGENAFNGTNLNITSLPVDLTIINNGVFGGTAIREIVIHEGITHIGNSAFFGASELTEITLLRWFPAESNPEDRITTLGTNVFNGTNILHYTRIGRIYVPKGSLGDYRAATNWNASLLLDRPHWNELDD